MTTGISVVRNDPSARLRPRRWPGPASRPQAVKCRASGRQPTHHPPPTHAPTPGNPLRLIVVGGGASGYFGALRAKAICSALDVLVLEAALPLAKVAISGGGRCNVTTGETDSTALADYYPRGRLELRSFFRAFGPLELRQWFERRGVELKVEPDGRVFPASDSSETIIRCLQGEAKALAVTVVNCTPVLSITKAEGRFEVTLGGAGASTIIADFILVATGGSPRGHALAASLDGHRIVSPVPSLFTFNVQDAGLVALAGLSFPLVNLRLDVSRSMLEGTSEAGTVGCGGARDLGPHLVASGPLLITHWGLSGPAVLKLSAWGARLLAALKFSAPVVVDFVPGKSLPAVIASIAGQKRAAAARKVAGAPPFELELPRRFWAYLAASVGVGPDVVWAALPPNCLAKLAERVKACRFQISGKGIFKDEFVTAGGVDLAQVSLNTMESKLTRNLYFSGEVLNVDGVTGASASC